MSKRQVQALLVDLFGIDLSVGAISEGEAEISAALAPMTAEAHAHVQAVVHADETGYKQCGARQWMWLVAAGMVAVFLAAVARSAQATREALGECFAGILVSDHAAHVRLLASGAGRHLAP